MLHLTGSNVFWLKAGKRRGDGGCTWQDVNEKWRLIF